MTLAHATPDGQRFYREALERIKASRVPWPIVVMHLKNGLESGRTCGECSAFVTYWENERSHWPYCARAWSEKAVPPTTPACGKFRAAQTPSLPAPAPARREEK